MERMERYGQTRKSHGSVKDTSIVVQPPRDIHSSTSETEESVIHE